MLMDVNGMIQSSIGQNDGIPRDCRLDAQETKEESWLCNPPTLEGFPIKFSAEGEGPKPMNGPKCMAARSIGRDLHAMMQAQ